MDSSEDAETFQAWLRWRQFPADCRGTAGRVVWAGLRPGQGGKAGEEYPRQYFYALGLGSQMVALKMSFLSALLSPGRVLHWPTSHYINPLRCPSRSFGCYFAPITNCTLPPDLRNNRSGTPAAPAEPAGAVEDGRRLNRRSLRQRQGREREEDSIPEVCSPRGPGASRGRGWPASSFCRMQPASGAEHGSLEFEKVLWCTDTPRRRLSRLAGLRRVHSMAWYHAQISAFLFRPNAELRAFRAAVAPTLERRGNASGPSAQSGGTPRARLKREARAAWPTAPTANLSCAAMHVRRTDKKTEDPRASVTRDFSVYSRAYRAWAFWVSTAPKTGYQRVLLGSEDSATFEAMPPLLEPATTYFIPARHFVMDSSAGRAFQNIKQGNSRLAELYGLLEDEYEKEVKRGPAAAEAFLQSGALKDEGMALVLQILLMGECSSFFGSLSSNVGILVYDLQTALATRRRTTPYFFDANGRVYCGCGASFCMRLEKRSSKEPMRAYTDMVDAFHGDNAWAI